MNFDQWNEMKEKKINGWWKKSNGQPNKQKKKNEYNEMKWTTAEDQSGLTKDGLKLDGPNEKSVDCKVNNQS